MKKVLFVANSDRHINLCHLPYIKMFKDNGYIVHIITDSDIKNPYCDKKIKIRLKRNPYSITNFLAIFKIRKIAKNEKYDVVSCHTPIGGVLGRSIKICSKQNTKIIYTAHGFHFYKKSPKINWFIYYPIEKFLSRYTDLLVTMNEEDYKLAKAKFKCPCIKINGIGLDPDRLVLSDVDLKKELKLEDKFIVSYIAEISNRKNHPRFLKELKKYDLKKENIVILLIGDSKIKGFEEKVKECENVIYIDFKENIGDYINISDLIVFPSKQEGLPQSVVEALYFNKMVIAFDIRGCRDILNSNLSGKLVPKDVSVLLDEAIKYKNSEEKLAINNNVEKYLLQRILYETRKAYNKYLKLGLK